jgi:diacylglycerol kinase (ATP)
MAKKFSIISRIRSFKYGIRGIGLMLRSQHNAWIHAVATALVVAFGLFFGITRSQWCWLVLAIMAVWTAEALNTALEFLADFASAEFHPLIGKAKDVAAGAVLISAMGSVIIALFVLGPYALKFLSSLQSN